MKLPHNDTISTDMVFYHNNSGAGGTGEVILILLSHRSESNRQRVFTHSSLQNWALSHSGHCGFWSLVTNITQLNGRIFDLTNGPILSRWNGNSCMFLVNKISRLIYFNVIHQRINVVRVTTSTRIDGMMMSSHLTKRNADLIGFLESRWDWVTWNNDSISLTKYIWFIFISGPLIPHRKIKNIKFWVMMTNLV